MFLWHLGNDIPIFSPTFGNFAGNFSSIKTVCSRKVHPFKIQKCQKETSTKLLFFYPDSKIFLKFIKTNWTKIPLKLTWQTGCPLEPKYLHIFQVRFLLAFSLSGPFLDFFCALGIVLESFSIKKKNRMRPPSIQGKAWKWGSFSLRLFHATLLYAVGICSRCTFGFSISFLLLFCTFLVKEVLGELGVVNAALQCQMNH